MNQENIEKERLDALSQYQIIETSPEKEFDAIARLASYICQTPIALISFIDERRLWYKSSVGLDGVTETPRNESLCQFAIQGTELLEIQNIPADPYFSKADIGGSPVQFYAGIPLLNAQGYALGTICVADFSPRNLSSEQKDALQILATEVLAHLELRRKNLLLEVSIGLYDDLNTLFNNSSELHAMLNESGQILMISRSVTKILGYAPEEAIGKYIWEFCHEDEKTKVMQAIQAGLDDGINYFEAETRTYTKNGEIKWIGWNDTRQKDRWMVNGRDITPQKKSQHEQELLSLVASKVTNGVIISDKKNRTLWANSSFEKITGFSVEDLAGKPYSEILRFEDTDQNTLETARDHIRQKESFDIELLVKRKNSTPIWISIFSSIVLDANGEIDKEISIIADITKRKQTEEKLSILSLAASKTSSGLVIRNDKNEIIWMNKAFENITGFSVSDLIGTAFGDRMIGENTDLEVLENARAFVDKQTSYEIELQLYKKDKTPVWIFISNNPVFNESGKMEKQIAIVVDITERKKAEEQASLLSLVASKTVNGVAILDKNGFISWVNDAYENLTGYLLEEIKGKLAGDVLKGDGTSERELERARQLQKELQPFNLEILNYRKDNEPVWFSVSNTPVLDAKGNLIQFVEIVNDITERKYAEFELINTKEEALHLSKAKEMFLSVMSHEIRTPLNAVLGLSRILQEENTNPSQAQTLDLLRFSAENLLSLINDILDFTKIETGNLELESIEVPIKDLIEKTVSSIQFKAQEKGVTFNADVATEVPDTILGDHTRIYQILMNLLGNSVKFTEKGEIKIKLDLVENREESVVLRFEVSDTGIGIPKDKLGSIFEVYKQAGADTARKYGGTGLGLSITKKLIELHGSEIIVESEVGKGTQFSFVIEFKKADLEKREIKTFLTENHLKGRVLVADDNPINCFLARKVLSKWGIEIEFAENGQIALEKVQCADYNLVLMDLQMPVMGGIEASQAIRSLNGVKYKNLPIIALTASTLEDDVKAIEEAKMNGHVLKPFVPADLYEKIQGYFELEQ